MKQLARRASVVVILVLASVATASAQCAWVLWQEYGELPGTATKLSPLAAYSGGEVQCEEKRRELRSKLMARNSPPDVTVVDLGFIVMMTKTGSHKYDFTCLPDTIDPRWPKGK